VNPARPDERTAETCCGRPMKYQDIWNVRRYQCDHRSHHPVVYVNLATGGRITDEAGYGPSVIPWHEQAP
jgi:hypothetical protein